MANSLSDQAESLRRPAFTTKVISAMRRLYPEELADRTWDNVGLLQDNIDPSHALCDPNRPVRETVLLTNDLTLRVAEEAIDLGASVIVSYREFPLQSLAIAIPPND
jgi:putative NIF3 family GTP cyclohydrolase 1 type 2